jgi:hypothetical protein
VKPVEGTRQTSPVTSEEGVPLVVRGFTLQSGRGSQQSGLGNCLSKTQDCAKSVKTKYAVRRLPNTGRLRGEVSRKAKLLTEAPVNGGPNYEGLPRSARIEKGPHKTWLYAGNPVYPPLPSRVTMGEVRTIRRKPKGILRDCTPGRCAKTVHAQGWKVEV